MTDIYSESQVENTISKNKSKNKMCEDHVSVYVCACIHVIIIVCSGFQLQCSLCQITTVRLTTIQEKKISFWCSGFTVFALRISSQ